MMKYTFSGHRGRVTVEAADEKAARDLAMQKFWGGRPAAWGGGNWYGEGLVLVGREPIK